MQAQAAILPISDKSAIGTLLAACQLPAADAVPSDTMLFFGISQNAQLQALVGLELHACSALLRSLAVVPAQRRQGLGRLLLQHAEQQAGRHGVGTLYLLTTDASGYFQQYGYQPCPREQAPQAIRNTRQFQQLCPASAQLMRKHLQTF
jgi:amino-acid N-acetyltransferase